MSVFLDMVFGKSGKKTKLGKGYRLDKNGKLVKIAPNASAKAKAKWKGSKRARVVRRGTP
jgi:hypothetical protein